MMCSLKWSSPMKIDLNYECCEFNNTKLYLFGKAFDIKIMTTIEKSHWISGVAND